VVSRLEVVIGGVGGQGSILAGTILGQAAVEFDGKYAVQTQAYSSELRGGFAATWVILSDNEIIYPRVLEPDVLVAQAQDALNRFYKKVKARGIVIIDSDIVKQIPRERSAGQLYELPATSVSRKEYGSPIAANMILVGGLWFVTRVVTFEAMTKAIESNVPASKKHMNLKAFELGVRLAESLGWEVQKWG
jgi:2-oxoglutarate ferredoxin oxidoreductase subunit gamma